MKKQPTPPKADSDLVRLVKELEDLREQARLNDDGQESISQRLEMARKAFNETTRKLEKESALLRRQRRVIDAMLENATQLVQERVPDVRFGLLTRYETVRQSATEVCR